MFMRRWGFQVVTACLLLFCGTASAAQKVLNVGYLELDNDARYQPADMKARYPAKPWGRPYAAILVALEESKFTAMGAGVQFKVKRESAKSLDALTKVLKGLIAGGTHLVILDLPGNLVAKLAERASGQDVLLFNATALDDDLRQQKCQANLLDTAPSRTMLTDAMAQYLTSKKWRDVLVLKGKKPDDKKYYAAFQHSAKLYGLQVEDVRPFVLGTNPRQRGQNNVALLTAGASYDVVYVIDSDGEFARSVPYQIQQPRPVVGAAGLVPDWWQWGWARNGAPQLNDRFLRVTGRLMTGYDWSVWIAFKTISQAVQRTRSADFKTLKNYILSDKLVLDGFKGYRLDYRPWNHQLRQPIFLTTLNWVAGVAPLQGFLHQTNNLDTLGFDENKNECSF